MYKCLVCEDNVLYKHLGKHLRQKHPHIVIQDYYNKYLKNENEDICLICNKKNKFFSIGQGYQKTCSRSCACLLQRQRDSQLVQRLNKLSSERFTNLNNDSAFRKQHDQKASIQMVDKNKKRTQYLRNHEGLHPGEYELWNCEQFRQFNPRKQVNIKIGDKIYRVDFLIESLGIIVEINGSYHKTRLRYDNERENLLSSKFLVINFEKEDIIKNPLIVSDYLKNL